MRIAITYINSALFPSGISVSIFELANALLKDGHEVYLITGGEIPRLLRDIKNTFEVDRLPIIIPLQRSKKELYSPKLGKSLAKLLSLWLLRGSSILRTIKPEMIIINGAVPIFCPSFKVAVCHDLEFRLPGQLLYDRILYRYFDVITATSTELAHEFAKKLQIKTRKVTTIPICIDIRKYTHLPWEKREDAILHIGTWYDKNLGTSVRAFCKLADINPYAKLYVVGDLWEWPKKILSMVRKEFSARIYCVGRVTKAQLLRLYSKVKVTLVPSLYRIPVLSPTVLESLAAGTPVIGGSTAISGDLLLDGYNGYRVPCTDAAIISERALMLITQKDLWENLSINARATAEKFDAPVVAKKYISLFESYRNKA